MSSTCFNCSKIVYPFERIDAGNHYHKGCFRCMEESCDVALNLKTFQTFRGKIYCPKHVPSFKASSVLDMNTSHAMNVPKRSSEGLHKTKLGEYDNGSNVCQPNNDSLKRNTSNKIKNLMENFESKSGNGGANDKQNDHSRDSSPHSTPSKIAVLKKSFEGIPKSDTCPIEPNEVSGFSNQYIETASSPQADYPSQTSPMKYDDVSPAHPYDHYVANKESLDVNDDEW